MSLKDPDDDYDELVNEKSILPKGFLKKSKMLIFVLIIGLILGAFIQYYALNPVIADMNSNDCVTIKNTNAMLNTENDCLYYALGDNAKTASEKCATRNLIEKQNEKEFTEEAP
jgi:hypothetical protein